MEKKDKVPSEVRFPSGDYLNIDPNLIFEVATGLEDITEIAPRYGFKGPAIEALKVYEPFQLEVARVKAELYRTGKTFKMQAAIMAEEVLKRVFEDAVRSDATATMRLDALKTLSKLADLEPKTNVQASAGPGFSITINLNGNNQPAEVINVEQ